MTDQPRVQLVDWALTIEIDKNIVVEQEDSVRADWWRASCMSHDWSTTGSQPNVEDAAAHHVAWDHPACAAPSERTFVGTPLYCHLLPDHDDDHASGGYTWPKKPDTIAAPDPAVPPYSEQFQCPISTCAWTYDPPPVPVLDPGVLAHIFGPGVMSLRATNQYQEGIERALQAHFNTHTIAEYIAEIGNLTNLVIGLSAQVGKLTEIKHRDQALLDDLAQPKSGILGQYPTTGL